MDSNNVRPLNGLSDGPSVKAAWEKKPEAFCFLHIHGDGEIAPARRDHKGRCTRCLAGKQVRVLVTAMEVDVYRARKAGGDL
jgi:hypothetical protein